MMMRKILYNISITTGLLLFLVYPLFNIILKTNFKIYNTNLTTIGALVLCLTFLTNYYTCSDKNFRKHFWWQVPIGIYLLLVVALDIQNFFHNINYIRIILLVVIFIIYYLMYFKYEKNKGNSDKRARHENK